MHESTKVNRTDETSQYRYNLNKAKRVDFLIVPTRLSDIRSNGVLSVEWTLYLTNGESIMALSSIPGSSYGAAANRSTFAPTKTLNTLNTNPQQASTGRSADTFYCASCGGRKITPTFYCPTCSGGSAIRTSTPFANAHGDCPTCGKTDATRSAAAKQGAVYYSRPQVNGR